MARRKLPKDTILKGSFFDENLKARARRDKAFSSSFSSFGRTVTSLQADSGFFLFKKKLVRVTLARLFVVALLDLGRSRTGRDLEQVVILQRGDATCVIS